ncbi:GNAT family N-acetyltransferase [Alteribacter populi]|uniref:GNAT family N-acetyltransferase n=1 Tax=Alteribacter populi TaxID=2011011 RepID=UPI000BBB0948|nr:GNAT family N-acetyltransferase [Alteribacter populi]
MEVQAIDKKDLPALAEFIASLNIDAKHYIGYSSIESQGILHQFYHEFDEWPPERSFIIGLEDGKIIAALGCDCDLKESKGYLWGPFIINNIDNESAVTLANNLWKRLLNIVPASLLYFNLFYHNQHWLANRFADEHNFGVKETHHIFEAGKEKAARQKHSAVGTVSDEYDKVVSDLHDRIFPGTYYSGKVLVERAHDPLHNLWMIKDQDIVAGYLYAEVDGDESEGSIEFLAVDEAYQGRGFGRKLLEHALDVLFDSSKIKRIRLTVQDNKMIPLGLYERAGFELKSVMDSRKMKMRR